jgi:phospholipid-binding lipoprotein MlaA
VLNSTFGLAGFIDIATPGGLPERDEDFGQTLGYWGVGEGWYLMLPFFGPSNNRDLIGTGVDAFSSPLYYVDQSEVSITLGTLSVVEKRAGLLQADRFLAEQLDRYVFVRNIYLQNRQNKVYDGQPPQEDYGFEEEEEGDVAPAEEPAAEPDSSS